MFHELVVAVDGSADSLIALDWSIQLASACRAQLDVLSVYEAPVAYRSEQAERQEEISEAQAFFSGIHADAIRRGGDAGVPVTSAILAGHEGQAIIDYLRRRGADLLVLGARGRSAVWDVFLGGTADKLVAHAPTSVLVIHPGETGTTFKEIVVGLDGSVLGKRAFTTALELARLFGGTIWAVSVTEHTPTGAEANARRWSAFLENTQQRARLVADAAGVTVRFVTRSGHAAKTLIGYAGEVRADLIVIGATGQELPWSPTAGGTARRVANEAGCAVLLVRAPLVAHRVRQVMSGHVTSVAPSTPLRAAIDLLIRRGIKALPVVDKRQHVVGIVTGGDLLRRGDLGVRLSLHGDRDPAGADGNLARLIAADRTVEQVMTPRPQTILADAPIEEALHRLVTHRIKRLPVTDETGRLVGMVSRTDLLQAFAAAQSHASEEPNRALPLATVVRDLTIAEVPTLSPSAPADAVMNAVLDSPFRRVVVVDDARHVLGVITDRGIVERIDPVHRPSVLARLAGHIVPGTDNESLPLDAAALMEQQVYTIDGQATVADAVREFLARRVKRLVVVDEDGRLLGLLDRRLLLNSLLTPVTGTSEQPSSG